MGCSCHAILSKYCLGQPWNMTPHDVMLFPCQQCSLQQQQTKKGLPFLRGLLQHKPINSRVLLVLQSHVDKSHVKGQQLQKRVVWEPNIEKNMRKVAPQVPWVPISRTLHNCRTGFWRLKNLLLPCVACSDRNRLWRWKITNSVQNVINHFLTWKIKALNSD